MIEGGVLFVVVLIPQTLPARLPKSVDNTEMTRNAQFIKCIDKGIMLQLVAYFERPLDNCRVR
jgi:hypothetical protein